MESCESPVVSGTNDGLSSSTASQQHPSKPWNDHPSAQITPSNQPPSLEPISLSTQLQNPKAYCEAVKDQKLQQTRTPPQTSNDSSVGGQLHRGREGLVEEGEEGSCGEEDDDFEDLDDMEIDNCFPRLQPFPGMSIGPVGGTMPTLIRQQPTRRRDTMDSGSEEGEDDDEGSSDVENLAGEIVYQPDGSAYIVESLSQLIQSEGGLSSGLLSSNFLPGGGKPGETAGTSSSVYPQIINTFHIASSFGKWFGSSDQSFPNTSTPAGHSPVLHSFRVFDVRHKSNKDYLNSDGSAKKSCVSKDVPNNVDFSKFDGLALYGKGKPILMCFLCKLSFGYARSFATHAVHDHRMTLCEDERQILGHKHASAIIQGIGKDKEPLISFLEPKNKSSPSPPNLLPINSGQSFYGTFSGVHLEAGSNSEGGDGLLNKDSDSGLLNMAGLGSPKPPSLSLIPGAAKDSSPLPMVQERRTERPVGNEGTQRGQEQDLDTCGGQSLLLREEVASDDEEELLDEEEDEVEDDGIAVSCGSRSNSGGQVGESFVANQSISKSPLLMPSSALQPSAFPSAASSLPNSKTPASMCSSSARGSEERAAADGGGKSLEHPLSFNCQGPTVPKAMAAATRRESEEDGATCSAVRTSSPLSSNTAADESANRDSATAPEPNECPSEGDDDNAAHLHHLHHHHHHHHLSHSHSNSQHPGSCDMSGTSGGNGVECPKCDTVLGSSRSLGGHMTMMHSRNSCKTLKCPKCNWHYKYQQTLEAHMKEKHPDSGNSCVYCSSGQSHPRLARGESYTCGYKPFRCEVCNYSTTTKGNLSIHMQSDKHLNNMQTLQNGGSIPTASEQVFGHTPGGVVSVPSAPQTSSHHPSHHHHPAQSSTHIAGPCGAPSPTKPKSKPTWRCEVCDYETNVARNLRIHMTSEKHMHNMMLLQQNVTQMQHGRMSLGAMHSPSEAELYQYYLTQNMSLPPGLKMDPTGADAQFLLSGFHLDPNMASMAPGLGTLSEA